MCVFDRGGRGGGRLSYLFIPQPLRKSKNTVSAAVHLPPYSLVPPSVRGDIAPSEAPAGQAFEDADGDVHQRAEVEQQIVESVDGQSSGFICVLHGHNGGVEGVGQIAKSRATRLNDLLGAL